MLYIKYVCVWPHLGNASIIRMQSVMHEFYFGLKSLAIWMFLFSLTIRGATWLLRASWCRPGSRCLLVSMWSRVREVSEAGKRVSRVTYQCRALSMWAKVWCWFASLQCEPPCVARTARPWAPRRRRSRARAWWRPATRRTRTRARWARARTCCRPCARTASPARGAWRARAASAPSRPSATTWPPAAAALTAPRRPPSPPFFILFIPPYRASLLFPTRHDRASPVMLGD